MKNKTLLILILAIIFSCESKTEKEFKILEIEFKNHITKADKKTFKNELDKVVFYEKNNNVLGFEIESNGEFGKITRKYFLNKNKKINKIILRRNFHNYYNGAYDSIFKIYPNENKIISYSSEKDSVEIFNEKLIEEVGIIYKFYINEYFKTKEKTTANTVQN